MLDKHLGKFKHQFFQSVIDELPKFVSSRFLLLCSIISGVLTLVFASVQFTTLSYQFWNLNRLFCGIGAAKQVLEVKTNKILQRLADQIVYLGIPLSIPTQFQFYYLNTALLMVNNYMSMYSNRFKEKCIIGHTELWLIYSCCYLVPEFRDIFLLNLMGLTVLSILYGTMQNLKCKSAE